LCLSITRHNMNADSLVPHKRGRRDRVYVTTDYTSARSSSPFAEQHAVVLSNSKHLPSSVGIGTDDLCCSAAEHLVCSGLCWLPSCECTGHVAATATPHLEHAHNMLPGRLPDAPADTMHPTHMYCLNSSDCCRPIL
jgi:hypothetical protein